MERRQRQWQIMVEALVVTKWHGVSDSDGEGGHGDQWWSRIEDGRAARRSSMDCE